jgi:proteic killer suppression protein
VELRYATSELERQCTDDRYMQRTLGAQIAKTLRLRIAELRFASQMTDLLLGVGRWEELRGDRAGQWSARLSANWRLIVAPNIALSDTEADDGGPSADGDERPRSEPKASDTGATATARDGVTVVLVIEIVDYHQ